MARVILIEATPWRASNGVATAVRLAGGGSKAYTHKGFLDWIGGIVTEPLFTTLIGFDQSGWTGAAIPQVAPIQFQTTDKDRLTALADDYLWNGSPFTMSSGDDELAPGVWNVEMTGTIASVAVKAGQLTLTAADLSAKLNDPFLKARFAGTGGLEGGIEAANRIKRRTFGNGWNIEGRVLNKAANVFEFGDPSFQWQGFDDVRDFARSAAALTLLAWQGSAAATLTALIAAAAPTGGGVVAPSIAAVKWYTIPKGPLTADVRGEIAPATTPNLASAILAAAGGPAISNLAAANALRPETGGVHCGDESASTANLLDKVLNPSSLTWKLNPAGSVELLPFTFASSGTVLIDSDVERVETYKPFTTRRLGYKRNERVQSDGEISAAIALASLDPAAAAAIDAATDKLDGIEDEADVTSIVQVDTPSVTVNCDSSGVPLAGVLPISVPIRLVKNGAPLSAGVSWTYRIVTGGVNGKTTASSPTAISGAGSTSFDLASVEALSSSVEINGTEGGRERVAIIPIDKSIPPPPTGGSSAGGNTGGTAASDTTLASVNSATMAVISDELVVTVGSLGTVNLSASASVDKSGGGQGTFPVLAVFDWWNGSAWVDVGSEVQTSPDLYRYRDAEFGGAIYTETVGSLGISTAATGLTAGSSQKFRLKARTSASTAIHTISGVATAQG